MDFVKQWTICVCLTLLVSLILTLLSPKGNMKRFYSIIISVFIFISFLYPFGNINAYDFDMVDKLKNENVQFSEENTYAEIIKSNICNMLKENGIKGAVVNVSLTVDDKNIRIDDVQIAVGNEYDIEVVRKIIFENLGVNARVIHNGE